MRWKVVPSKKPDLASEANEAAVFGEVVWSRRIVMSPQLVFSTTSYVVLRSSARVGRLAPPLGFGLGWATSLQLADWGWSALAAGLGLFEPPPSSSSQPATPSATRQSRSARDRN